MLARIKNLPRESRAARMQIGDAVDWSHQTVLLGHVLNALEESNWLFLQANVTAEDREKLPAQPAWTDFPWSQPRVIDLPQKQVLAETDPTFMEFFGVGAVRYVGEE